MRDATPMPSGAEGARLDLSRIRHELRTPINHILGYSEMLLEEQNWPAEFMADLRRIHGGGRQLQALIAEYFDDEKFFQQRDLHRLYHELRTPVNQIIGYTELLQELAAEQGFQAAIPDLQKIHDAAGHWLALMEAYLIESDPPETDTTSAPVHSLALNTGLGFQIPEPRSAHGPLTHQGAVLIVDDDETNRDMLARRLRRYGCTVSAAPNGVQALKLARSQAFDLILLDMIMPGLDGFQVLAKLKAEPALREIPVIMLSALDEENGIARCIEMGAEDYLAKPFNPIFLWARIGACLEKRRLRERERQAFEALKASQKALSDELAEAAAYVRSLLPAPIQSGPVTTDWRFQPSTQLGGDALGYHWLDPRHLAFYVLDVCGHGVGAALLSVSIMHVLQTRALPGIDFADPGAVLGALNRAFSMEENNNMFFTLWYGVLATETRELAFACGGHPPAVLLPPDGTAPCCLRAAGAILGGFPDANYAAERRVLARGSRVYVFSDGVYELARADGSTVQLEEFVAELAQPVADSKLDAILNWAASVRAGAKFEDDLSLLELRIA